MAFTGRYDSDGKSCDHDVSYEVTFLNSKLDSLTKAIRMLNNGSNMLDKILQFRKGSGNLKGVDFNYQPLKKQGGTSVTKFIPLESKSEFAISNKLSQHSV